jgi:hypothetical protein
MDELAGLTDEGRALAMERFRLLQPHLENDEPLTGVAKAAGIPYRTAHRMVSEYRRFGLPITSNEGCDAARNSGGPRCSTSVGLGRINESCFEINFS